MEGRTLAVDGLDEAWPAIVTGRLVDAHTGAELPGELELLPPSALGSDPLARRESVLADESESDLVLALDGPGNPVLPVQRSLSDELAHREGRVQLSEAAAARAAATEGSRGASRALAPWLLGLGLFLVASAALVRDRQGSGRNVR
jgi:hypothetical protein